jgi:hypothetical protein
MSQIGRLLRASVALLCLLVGGGASGALQDRGGGLIYDTDRNITWLADANYAKTSGYDSDGRMNWYAATAWAANLSYYDSVRGVWYDDWRLPTSLGPDGVGCWTIICSNAELGHLMYIEAEMYGTNSMTDSAVLNANFFNMQLDWYWLAEYSVLFDMGWAFYTATGGWQDRLWWEDEVFAWAVRDGDVASSTAPEPSTVVLLGLGLAGLAASRRRKQ